MYDARARRDLWSSPDWTSPTYAPESSFRRIGPSMIPHVLFVFLSRAGATI